MRARLLLSGAALAVLIAGAIPAAADVLLPAVQTLLQLRSRTDDPRPLHQRPQDGKFAARQQHGLAVERDLQGSWIEQKRAKHQLRRGSTHGSTVEGAHDIRGILGADSDVRNGYNDIKVTFSIDADASQEDIEALVAQSQKRSAVFDALTNPTNVTVEVA